MVGKMRFCDLLVPAADDELKAAASRLFAERKVFRDFPNANVAKNGRIVHLETSGTPVLDADGTFLGFCGADTDVTLRKQSEAEIVRQRDEVAHLARVTTLGEISGSLAHELNQPLGAILANAEAAMIHLKSDTPDLVELREILAEIRRDDMRAGEIIHGIRDFLRHRPLALEPLVVRELADEAVRLVSADAAKRKISIGLEIPPDLPPAMADRVHVQQVLVNLLVNGMDAVDTCPVASRRLILRAAECAPGSMEFSISDSGIGIPPASLDRVFDPFHTSKSNGLGLGLAICRSIIEAHGGSITIENNPDCGATARFTLRSLRKSTVP
jgi:C4-dicarboxylate-specific signal transduction histidine kinase